MNTSEENEKNTVIKITSTPTTVIMHSNRLCCCCCLRDVDPGFRPILGIYVGDKMVIHFVVGGGHHQWRSWRVCTPRANL
jgi:hypothetical protein